MSKKKRANVFKTDVENALKRIIRKSINLFNFFIRYYLFFFPLGVCVFVIFIRGIVFDTHVSLFYLLGLLVQHTSTWARTHHMPYGIQTLPLRRSHSTNLFMGFHFTVEKAHISKSSKRFNQIIIYYVFISSWHQTRLCSRSFQATKIEYAGPQSFNLRVSRKFNAVFHKQKSFDFINEAMKIWFKWQTIFRCFISSVLMMY